MATEPSSERYSGITLIWGSNQVVIIMLRANIFFYKIVLLIIEFVKCTSPRRCELDALHKRPGAEGKVAVWCSRHNQILTSPAYIHTSTPLFGEAEEGHSKFWGFRWKKKPSVSRLIREIEREKNRRWPSKLTCETGMATQSQIEKRPWTSP